MNIDKQIIKALKSGSEPKILSAFNDAYNLYRKLVYFCIAQYVPSKEDAEELMNDTFIKVYNHIEFLKINKSLKYYLTTTAKNLAIDFNRKKRFEILQLDEEITSATGNEKYDEYEIYRSIGRFLEPLDAFIVTEHLAYDRSFRDIAQERDMSINTIMTKYRRAMAKIKKNLEKEA